MVVLVFRGDVVQHKERTLHFGWVTGFEVPHGFGAKILPVGREIILNHDDNAIKQLTSNARR